MNKKQIICIDLRKYNYEQLTKVSDFVGINDGSLQSSKKEGVIKVFFDNEKRLFIGELLRDASKYSFHYKNLILTKEYSILSKKEKDILISMSGIEISTKTKTKTENIKPVKETEISTTKYPEVELKVDAILDKILDYGMESLTKREKDFLDNQ